MAEEEAGPSAQNGEDALTDEQIINDDPVSQNYGTFAEILKANTALQVAFYSEPTKIFSESEKLDFIDTIGDILFKLPEDAAMPNFVSTTRRDKYLIISASDEYSRDWLLKIASSITIGAYKFHSIPANEIPKLKRGLLWLPGKLKRSDEELLDRLRKQNGNLSLENWKIIKRHEEPHGVRLLIGVPEQSINSLAAVENRPQWSTARATFTPIEEVIKRKKVKKPDAPKPDEPERDTIVSEDAVQPNIVPTVEKVNDEESDKDPGPSNTTFTISKGCSRAEKRKPEADISLGKDSTPESEAENRRQQVQAYQTPPQRPPLVTKSMARRNRKKMKENESPAGKITAFFPGAEAHNSTPKSSLEKPETAGMSVSNHPPEANA